mgnify:CR=1 FL=1
MKYLIVTPPGFEEVICREIKTGVVSKHGRIFADERPRKPSPGVKQIYKLLDEGFKLEKLKLPKTSDSWLLIKDVPRGDIDYDKIRKKVNATNPESEHIFRVDILDGKTYLSKKVFENPGRKYQVNKFPFSLKPEIAYCMVQMLKPEKFSVIYDPFCGSGTIPIEMALNYSKITIWGSDLNKNYVNSSIKNAKKAEVRQNIRFFEKDIRENNEKADYVISELPFQFKDETLKDIYKGLLSVEAEEYILLTEETELLKKAFTNYSIKFENKVIKGGKKLRIIHFVKSKTQP